VENSNLVRLAVTLHNFRFVRGYTGPLIPQAASFFHRTHTRISIATRNRSSANCHQRPINLILSKLLLLVRASSFTLFATRTSPPGYPNLSSDLSSAPDENANRIQAFEIPSASRLRPMGRGDASRAYRKPCSAGIAEMPISGYHSRAVPPTNPVNNGRQG